MDKKSFVLGIFVTIGIIAFVGIAFADSEIGDRIVALWFHGNISNTTGYLYSNLTGVPINITHNDTENNFTKPQIFSEGINVSIINMSNPVYFSMYNITSSANLADSTFTKNTYGVEESDYYNMCTPSNGSCIIPMSGYYKFYVLELIFNGTLAGQQGSSRLNINNAHFELINGVTYAGTGKSQYNAGSIFAIYLNKSDVVWVESYDNSGTGFVKLYADSSGLYHIFRGWKEG